MPVSRRVLPTPDGAFLLSESEGQLSIGPLSGGAGEMLARSVAHGMWSPVSGGACVLNFATSPAFVVECIHVASKKTVRVASLGEWPRVYGPPGFTVSPDGKWIFYSRVDQLESNIMLADGVF